MDLVDAQQTRRIMDRIVGYTLSPLISRKVRSGLSAGRVQSVAVRLVVERERAIEAFEPREYWTLQATLRTARDEPFTAALVRVDGTPLARGGEVGRNEVPIADEATARGVRRCPARRRRDGHVGQGAQRAAATRPRPSPRARSSRRPAASSATAPSARCPWPSASTRASRSTASPRASSRTCGPTRSTSPSRPSTRPTTSSAERFGSEYAVKGGRGYRNRTKGAQEAHEAIRPTSFERDPESLKGRIKDDELRLYRLIWQRALASQMAAKAMETTSAELEAGRFGLRASATRTIFDGFTRVYTEGRDDEGAEEADSRLPDLAEGEQAHVDDVSSEQHFTEPPPRFTEATLIKALEEHGIGRPSTYAATISTITDRGYVKVEDRRLRPEVVAGIVTDVLVEHFGDYVDVAFTARMEEELDEVARGEREWVPLLRDFYDPLMALVDEKRRTLTRRELTTEETDEVCSEGHPMVIRLGRNGRFLACSLYPEHKETRPIPGEEPELPTVEGRGRDVPQVRRGHARGAPGPLRGLRRL